jgi:hypothetical protein
MLARIWSVVFVQTNGVPAVLDESMYWRMGLEHPDAGVRAAAQCFGVETREPALDLVEPRRVSRREMHMKARVLREPCAHGRRFVRAVVVHDDVDLQIGRHAGVDRFAGALHALTDPRHFSTTSNVSPGSEARAR